MNATCEDTYSVLLDGYRGSQQHAFSNRNVAVAHGIEQKRRNPTREVLVMNDRTHESQEIIIQ